MATREYFDAVRRASEDIERCRRTIDELADWLPSRRGVPVGSPHGSSDPVYSSYTLHEAMLSQAKADMNAALEMVGEALVYIGGLRHLSPRMADVLELYYVDRLSWGEVAAELHIGRSTARLWRNIVCDEADKLPRAYVMGMAGMENS